MNCRCVAPNYGTLWLLCGELVHYVLCLVHWLNELGFWVVPACTWDKGEYQCHPPPPCDSRDRAVWQAGAVGPLSVDLELLWMLLQKARVKGETAESWKVVFVSRPCRHTVVQSLVQLGAFSHWQTLVWWRQHHIAAAVSTLQALLPRGDSSVLKKQQRLMAACCWSKL